MFRHSSDVLALRSCFPTLKLASALRALRRCFLLFISDLKSSLVVIPAKFYNGPWRPFQWGGARASLQIFAHGKYANPRSLSCFLQVEHLFKHHVFEHSLHTEAVSIQAKLSKFFRNLQKEESSAGPAGREERKPGNFY